LNEIREDSKFISSLTSINKGRRRIGKGDKTKAKARGQTEKKEY